MKISAPDVMLSGGGRDVVVRGAREGAAGPDEERSFKDNGLALKPLLEDKFDIRDRAAALMLRGLAGSGRDDSVVLGGREVA